MTLPRASALLLLLLAGCKTKEPPGGDDTAPTACDPAVENADAPPLVAGAPVGGVAEAVLELPVGTPLSGYTSRCSCFGNDGDIGNRDSQYVTEFNPSAGVQAPITLKAFWIGNGDQDLVILKVDLIYSFDGLVEEMEDRLSAATGRDLDGKVVIATNHSHSAYGDYSDQVTYFLGSDRFNYEVFTRLAEQAEAVAMEAYDGLQPVKLGLGVTEDWDPDDRVYRDRRNHNDTLQFFDDIPAGRYKDPTLTVLRIDTLDDEPLGVLFDFGMHGTILGADSQMVSPDAPGHVEIALQEMYDRPVVVGYLQGAAGDASPGGSDDGYARLESVGMHAEGPIHALWARTATSADPILLESVGRSVGQTHQEIRVTRGGTRDMHYLPYDEDYEPDNVVYDDQGEIVDAIDEFNVPYGAAFCGEDPPYLAGFAPAEAFPYVQCVELSMMVNVIAGFFDLSDEEKALPLLESHDAGVLAARIDGILVTDDAGGAAENVLFGFFPGETTALYTEQFRRRARAELGYDRAVAVGYAQDHEGYLLVPEDWLMGGYEADINVWGPLQAEHIMEGVLGAAAEELSTPVDELPDPCGLYQPPDYGLWELPSAAPDITPEAGTVVDVPPDGLYSPLYTFDEFQSGVPVELSVPAEVPRVQGMVTFAWLGGDPGVDHPEVVLERQVGDDWQPVTTRSGRVVRGGPDILVTWTPDPVAPADIAQTHTWYAAWQAVAHHDDRAGLEPGTYRLHVYGKAASAGASTWPWATYGYEVTTDPFTVIPGAVTVWESGDGVRASLRGPARGYRLVGPDGNYRGDNPLPDDVATLALERGDGSVEVIEATGSRSGGSTAFTVDLTDVVRVTVTDRHGNTGELAR